MLKTFRFAVLGLTAALVLPAAAAQAACWVPYGDFEENVAHVDMPECPGEAAADSREGKVFCRAGIDGAEITIWRFNVGADASCMVAAETMSLDSFFKANGTTAGK